MKNVLLEKSSSRVLPPFPLRRVFYWPFFDQVILYDALDLKVLNKVVACRSRVVAVSFSRDGKLLATASEQGTVIRIFTVPGAVKVQQCSFSSAPKEERSTQR